MQENDKYMLINNDWLIDKEKNQMFIESYKYKNNVDRFKKGEKEQVIKIQTQLFGLQRVYPIIRQMTLQFGLCHQRF